MPKGKRVVTIYRSPGATMPNGRPVPHALRAIKSDADLRPKVCPIGLDHARNLCSAGVCTACEDDRRSSGKGVVDG